LLYIKNKPVDVGTGAIYYSKIYRCKAMQLYLPAPVCTCTYLLVYFTVKLLKLLKVHNGSVADPHPDESAWFGSPGSASGIRIPNADSSCGCGSGINYVKIAPMKKKLKFLNISLVYFKGKVQREFRSVFLHVWTGLRLNKNRLWF
jgi:hypothetical protein